MNSHIVTAPVPAGSTAETPATVQRDGVEQPPDSPDVGSAVRPPGPVPVQRRGRYASVVLAALILVYVFSRIQFGTLIRLASNADMATLLAGLLLSPVVVILGAVRWHVLIEPTIRHRVGVGWSIKQYWQALAVGMVTPGAVGMDVYRVMAVGQCGGGYASPAVTVVVEKLIAFLGCALLLMALLRVVDVEPGSWVRMSAWPIAASVAAAAVFALMSVTSGWGLKWSGRLFSLLRRILARGIQALAGSNPQSSPVVSLVEVPRAGRAAMAIALALSVAAYATSALQAHLFFLAIGQSVPLVVNLLIAPLLFLIFALPISFGTVGVREASYITLYGIFGASAEAALLVSFIGLLGLGLNAAIGAAFLAGRVQAREARGSQ